MNSNQTTAIIPVADLPKSLYNKVVKPLPVSPEQLAQHEKLNETITPKHLRSREAAREAKLHGGADVPLLLTGGERVALSCQVNGLAKFFKLFP